MQTTNTTDATATKDTTLRVRRASERGHADHGWLNSFHTFAFADYMDPAWQGFRNLRVINEDRVAPGEGFPNHGHRDMEIVSYVLSGALEHKDSIGTGSVIRPGDVQRMTAGTGVIHSEYNASKTDPVHFLQIWIQPKARGLLPEYEQKTFFAEDEKRGGLRVVASPDGAEGSVTLHADARILAAVLRPGDTATYVVPVGRHAWVHVARGNAKIGANDLGAGDAAYTSTPGAISIAATSDAEVLVFDLG